VAVDDAGNVYVSDTYNNRMQKFDSSGNFVTKWGGYGESDGLFYSPVGVAVDNEGSVYVVEDGNYRIQKFDSDGNFLAKWGSRGNGDGQFWGPDGVATDQQGNVYVADTQNHRIQKFAFRPAYEWGGFFPPVKNPSAFNEVNAGRPIPVKFSLGGDRGLDVVAEGSPTSRRIDCDTRAPSGAEEPATSTGASGLTYEEATGQYTYMWRTQRSWKGTCRELALTLADGTEHEALFRLK
jgi:DNA-binding beta-propeller fold protein YncE